MAVGDSNPNVDLIYAAKDGDVSRLKEALVKGANINIEDFNEAGFTALMHASYKGYVDCVEILIKAKADLNRTDSFGDNAFILAVNKGNLDCADKLIHAGTDISGLSFQKKHSDFVREAFQKVAEFKKEQKQIKQLEQKQLKREKRNSFRNYIKKGMMR